MKFTIERTSDWGGEQAPCQAAQRDGDYWVIEIETLEDLLKLRDETGDDLIVGRAYAAKDMPSIEIYDTYRE